MATDEIREQTEQNICQLCGLAYESDIPSLHHSKCAENLSTRIKESQDPFDHWKLSVALDHAENFEESGQQFSRSAQIFFESGSILPRAAKALFEYSTLMDAFSYAAKGRLALSKENFSDASQAFTKSSEILRSTIHFAFLAPYIAACGILHTALGLDGGDEDAFEAYKSANALLEQAKFALSLKDERSPLATVFDALLKRSISLALRSEAISLAKSGSNELSKDKMKRSEQVHLESNYLSRKAGLEPEAIEFFPLRDFNFVERAVLILAYPEGESLWLVNVGKHPALIEKLGNVEVNQEIRAMDSWAFQMKLLSKGKVRAEYLDTVYHVKYDVGCLTLV